MDVVTCDIETFYSREFSLKKMSTERYIRDPRFEIIGVAVKVNGEQSDWYSGENFGRFLHGMKYHDKAILGHNVAFDGAILSWLFNINPKLWLDTMSMARPFHAMTEGVSLAKLVEHYGLGAKGTEVLDALGKHRSDFSPSELAQYGRYCCNDADLTYALFNKLKTKLPKQEFVSIDQTIRMYTQPEFELDVPLLQKHLLDVRVKKDKLLDEVLSATAATYQTSQSKEEAVKSLMSSELLAGLLRKHGVEPPTKISAKTGKLAYAFAKTDQDFLDLLEHDDAIIQTLVSARLGIKSTLEETRTEAFIGIASRGKLPIMLNYYGAHTGRYSGGDKVNLQNLPRGGMLRKALMASAGHVVITSDLAQIEARMLAFVAGQTDLVEAFDQGRDVYAEFASEVYGRLITKADKVERFVGKTCIAEGQLVLTDAGLVPIEEITLAHRVWDGLEWVSHEGLVFQGCKKVLSYDGLTATADHGVFTERGPVPFGLAASRMERLITAGVSGEAVRVSGDYFKQPNTPWEEHTRVREMYLMFRGEMDKQRQLNTRYNSRLPVMQPDKIAPHESPRQEVRRNTLTMQKPQQPRVQTLRRARHPTLFRQPDEVHQMGRRELTARRLQRRRDRSDKQQLKLRAGQLKASDPPTTNKQPKKLCLYRLARCICAAEQFSVPVQSKLDVQSVYEGANRRANTRTVPVYDILNCGPRRRFTVSGKLVLNCILGLGYGTGWEKLQKTLAIGQAGIKCIIDDMEAKRIVALYRTKNHKIVKLWERCKQVLGDMARGNSGVIIDTLDLRYEGNKIILPNGLPVNYPGLEYRGGGMVYYKHKKAIKIYGAKMVENIMQALARIVISGNMIEARKRYNTVLQVHDEIVFVAPKTEELEAKDFIGSLMRKRPFWAPGLPVECEVGSGPNYGEAK